MNRIYPTPKGFVLVTDQNMTKAELHGMAERLNDVTGVTWVIIHNTEESVEAKYILAGKKFEETVAKISKASSPHKSAK